MYCRACLDIFRVYHRRLVEKSELTLHQQDRAVYKSYRQGCCICTRLWNQLIAYRSLPFKFQGIDPYSELSSFYEVTPILDQVEKSPGIALNDLDTEVLSSSGLEYTVQFGWLGLLNKYGDGVAHIEYQVIATESIGCTHQNTLEGSANAPLPSRIVKVPGELCPE